MSMQVFFLLMVQKNGLFLHQHLVYFKVTCKHKYVPNHPSISWPHSTCILLSHNITPVVCRFDRHEALVRPHQGSGEGVQHLRPGGPDPVSPQQNPPREHWPVHSQHLPR